MRKFKFLWICLDMHGCPNRCLHCWLGHGPPAAEQTASRMSEDDLRFAAEAFRPFTRELKVHSWYREPDFPDNYRLLWELENALSTKTAKPHDELMSVWRAARDPEYVPWLAGLGLKACQLTLFGGEAMTDKYTGRKGAYRDILRSIEQLLANGIAPRIQTFVNRETIEEMHLIDDLIRSYSIELAFAHQGSCTGAGAALYDVFPVPETLERMPPLLTALSLKHWKAKSLAEIFGTTEQALCQKLVHSRNTRSFVTNKPVFFIDRNWEVYPNISAPAAQWRLGNLKRDGAGAVIERYLSEISPAQAARRNTPLGEMVRACGDPNSRKLFAEGDYREYILDQYCERELNV